MVSFDLQAQNFGLGVLAGWASAYALYRSRQWISAARQAVTQQATSAQEYATQTAGVRYVRDLTAYCQRDHLAGPFFDLSQVVVEPRFVLAPELAAPQQEDGLGDVFDVVPKIPDLPYLQAHYNVKTLSIEELDNGHRHMALLGVPGSGRTTALQTIALWSMGVLNFELPKDAVQERLEAEETELNDEERAQRIKDRLAVQDLAMQKLSDAEETKDAPSFRELVPIYVHLSNITLNTSEFGRRIDPAEPLLRAVQQYTGRITSRTLARSLYEQLNEGKALLLIDGLDELPPTERQAKSAWLRAMLDIYAENFFIVAGPANGYGDLIQAGLSPVYMRPWQDISTAQLARKWVDVWPDVWKRLSKFKYREELNLAETTIFQAQTDSWARTPYEVTLKTWGLYEDPQQTDFQAWMDNYLRYIMPHESMEILSTIIYPAVTLQLDRGYITLGQLEQLLAAEHEADSAEAPANVGAAAEDHETGEIGGVEYAAADAPLFDDDEDDLNTLLDDGLDEPFETEGTAPVAGNQALKPAITDNSGKIRLEDKEVAQFFNRLVKAGVLRRFRGNRYQFRHQLLSAYFGALALKAMPEEQRLARINDAGWQQAFVYLGMLMPVDDIVQARLDMQPDLLHSQVVEMARWLAYADDPAWRGKVLSRLGNMLIAPDQYKFIRERVASALVGSRQGNVVRVFLECLSHENADVRRLACLGLGAMDAQEQVGKVIYMLDDRETSVATAAGMTLGALGTEAALEEMAVILTEANERNELLCRTLAETFATNPQEGYPLLYDAVSHPNLFLRRAAVFGLRRINTPWAIIALYQVSAEDEQQYVRLAAESAFYDPELNDTVTGVNAYPPVAKIPWLQEWWAQQTGEAIEDQKPEMLLQAVLQEGPPLLRQLAVTVSGQLGVNRNAGLLYNALRDQRSAMREAAYRALAELQLQTGRAFPSPV